MKQEVNLLKLLSEILKNNFCISQQGRAESPMAAFSPGQRPGLWLDVAMAPCKGKST